MILDNININPIEKNRIKKKFKRLFLNKNFVLKKNKMEKKEKETYNEK
jgi:hypothetical protein